MSKRIFYIEDNKKDSLESLFDYDEIKFRNSYVNDLSVASQTQLAAKLVFHSHSLEKSLSNDDFEAGHGLQTVKMLVDILNIYKEKNYDQKNLSYVCTISALREYYEKHKPTEYIEDIENIFGELINEIKSTKSRIGGARIISYDDKADNDKKNFEELSKGRFSIRSYSKSPVNKKDIIDAIRIATKTPTACNRQLNKVRIISKEDIIKKVLEVQGGILYYNTPPVLLLITADDSGYIAPNERNQGFIDGGLFAMSVLYALEYKKLAACPLHTMFDELTEKQIRGMLNVPENEKLITFISIGNFKKNSGTCKSFRYPVGSIIIEQNKLYDFEIIHIDNGSTIDEEKDIDLLDIIRKKLRIRTRLLSTWNKLQIIERLRFIKRKLRIRTRIRIYLAIIKNNKKTGAIISLTGYFNYGNILQRYALKTFLRQKGYVFDSIRTQEHKERQDRNIFGNMIDFVEKNINETPFDDINILSYKNYIVGSDQVWRDWYDGDWGKFGIFFLDFLGKRKANRIAYAASFGVDNLKDAGIDEEKRKLIHPLIKKFNHISMREESGVKLVGELIENDNYNTKVVLDPVFLLKKEDYSRLIDNSKSKNRKTPRLFCYILDKSDEKSEIINKISNSYNKDCLIINPDEHKKYEPIEEWLKGFRDSDFVITDSFHGIVLSIINNKNFIVFGNQTRGLSRMECLLDYFDIKRNRIIYPGNHKLNTNIIMNLDEINWKFVNSKIDEGINHSSEWLSRVLNK